MNYFLLAGIVLQILFFDCISSQGCRSDQFQCKNKRCILKGVTCDGEDDCGDESDELNSLCTTCTDDQFVCTNDRNCIALNLKCNKVTDCADGTDEYDCGECSDGLLPCLNASRCYKVEEKCDGFSDCDDNSDEFDCPSTGTTTVVVPTSQKKTSVTPTKTTSDISTISTTTSEDDSVDIKKVQDYSTIIIISVVVVGLLLITIVVTLGMIFVVGKKYKSNPKIKPLSLEERAAYLNQEPRRAANTYNVGYYATLGERRSVHSGDYDDVKGPQSIECTDNIYNTIDVDLGTDEETYLNIII